MPWTRIATAWKFPPNRKISVTADSVVCRASNVDITSRTCELAFGAGKRLLKGREANELTATLAAAGVAPEGAAGSIIESITKLACTIDPNEIRQKAGGNALSRRGSESFAWGRNTRPPAVLNPRGSTAMDVQRFLLGLGLVLVVAALLWPILSRIGLGRLPGDILFQRGGATFYFPLVTSIIISIVLSVLLWLFNR